MDIKINPKPLSGRVEAPPSKSVAHRLLICASLAKGESVIRNISSSKDMQATISCMIALGAQIELKDGAACIKGIERPEESAELDCCESGSTLRFLIPVACALGARATFIGEGRLPNRPITPYLEALPLHGVSFEYDNTMPFTVSGQLTAGRYEIRGDISSQFITGLLLALPMLDGDLCEIFEAIYDHRLADVKIGWKTGFCTCVVMASGGYPVKYEKGIEISGLDDKGQVENAFVYHAGTKLDGGKFLTNGGRVLGVTCNALTLQGALDKSYEAISKISWKDEHHRKDIGQRALKALHSDPLDLEYKQDMEDYIEENGVYLRQ